MLLMKLIRKLIQKKKQLFQIQNQNMIKRSIILQIYQNLLSIRMAIKSLKIKQINQKLFIYSIYCIDYLKMSAQLQANRRKLEEMKARRQNRQLGTASEIAESVRSDINIKLDKKQHSIQKSQHIHVSGLLVQTYDMEVQCALQTRSLDSRPAKQRQEQEKEIDLLLPRQHKTKKRDDKKQDHTKQIHQLTGQEINSVVKSRNFTDFFNKSSKFLQKVLDHGDGDMIQMLLKEGLKSRDKSGNDTLTQTITFTDPNYTNNRVVTDLDWSPQINQLFLASYSQNQEGSIKDHVGVILLWNPTLKNRAEFYCFCQSSVTSAKFYPFSNSTVLGGCYNGQILLWDIRAKSMPVQRSGISADAHKYPVCSLNVVGTQIANNIVSYSNDGMMCMWDIKQFSKPTRMNKLSANRSQRTLSKPSALNTSLAANRSLRPETSTVSNTSSILDRTTSKQQVHDINISCCKFPVGDANNYYVGSLNGVLYKNALHNKGTEKIAMYDEHNGPISGISLNNPSQYDMLNGLMLTSSFDWTVKLWHSDSKESLRTFQNSQDYIYDVSWHPNNPSLFASANNDGYLDIYDLTRDLQLPIAHQKVSRYAQNKCLWNYEGSAIVSGDSSGNVSLFALAQKYRAMEKSKYEDLERYLSQKPQNE